MRAMASRTISVSVYPGHTALTVTPVCATSSASERVSPITPCLAAQYAATLRYPINPAVLAMLTMRPHGFCSSGGNAARVQWNTPLRFTRSVSFHSSSEIASNAADVAPPALLTRTSGARPASTRSAKSASTAAASPISQAIASLRSSARRSSAPSSLARSRPTSVNAAPIACRRCPIAKPMPLAPPVTSARVPASASPAYEDRARSSLGVPTDTPGLAVIGECPCGQPFASGRSSAIAAARARLRSS